MVGHVDVEVRRIELLDGARELLESHPGATGPAGEEPQSATALHLRRQPLDEHVDRPERRIVALRRHLHGGTLRGHADLAGDE